MSKAKAAPPPGCSLNISDPQVQEAAIRIQASYRGHRYQNVQRVLMIQLPFEQRRGNNNFQHNPARVPLMLLMKRRQNISKVTSVH